MVAARVQQVPIPGCTRPRVQHSLVLPRVEQLLSMKSKFIQTWFPPSWVPDGLERLQISAKYPTLSAENFFQTLRLKLSKSERTFISLKLEELTGAAGR